MTNSQLLALLKAIEIISDLSETKAEFKEYISQIGGQIKKSAESTTSPAD